MRREPSSGAALVVPGNLGSEEPLPKVPVATLAMARCPNAPPDPTAHARAGSRFRAVALRAASSLARGPQPEARRPSALDVGALGLSPWSNRGAIG